MKLFRSKQFVIFIITGGIAAIANFLSRIIYNYWFDFSTSIVIAYITGMITAFILARLFVFKESQQSLHHSVFYFILVNLFAISQTWIVSMSLALYFFPWIGWQLYVDDISHAIGVIVPVFSSYFGHKYISFR